MSLCVIILALWGPSAGFRRIGKAKETLKYDTDYDCNGNGQNDCGRFDYLNNKCANLDKCEFRKRNGDYINDQSCRCKGAPTEYDCDGDGDNDCGTWDMTRVRCNNPHKCAYNWSTGDEDVQESCRCKAECVGMNAASCIPQADEYDCDGDGNSDCGEWDYNTAQCSNKAKCMYESQLGDVTWDQSCRCKRCANHGQNADADANLGPEPNPAVVGSSGWWARWINWADHMGKSCAPWMMPQNDDDLRKLLSYAASKNYKVRPSGAGHSAGGLVNDGESDNVMVVSLGAYKAPADWEYSLDEGAKILRVNAGWSQLDVYERVRPKNLFFPTQTAGYFFQLAGVVANSVHGAGYQNSFVHAYVRKMRVMTADGNVKIISGDDLKYWRNSYGLLGLILGVEMQLVERKQHQMYTKTTEMAWTEENFWKFIYDNAEADLPGNLSGGTRTVAGSQKSIAGEFFINMLPDKPAFIVYANKENGNADERGIATDIPANIASNYQELRNDQVEKFQHNGKISYGESIRKEGCPAIFIDPFRIINVNRLVGSRLIPTLGRVINPISFSALTISQMPGLVKEQRDRSNDGYFAIKAPNTLIAAYFIKPELAFRAFDFQREAVKRRNGQATWFNASGFSWNQPAEFRFMKVTDDAVLQPVPPGWWFVSEILSFPDSAATDQAWKEAFKEIEDYWINELGAVPHIGKLFAFDEVDGKLEMFSQRKVCKVYPSSTKNAFKTYQSKEDPGGLFNYGLGEKLLRNC